MSRRVAVGGESPGPAGCGGEGDGEVAELFRSLNYPIDLRPVSSRIWQECGLDFQLSDSLTIFHACSLGILEILFVRDRGTTGRSAVVHLFKFYRRRNRLRKIIIILVDDNRPRWFVLCDQTSVGRVRHLEVDLSIADSEASRRLTELQLDSGTVPDREEIEARLDKALDREALSRRFFRRFREAIVAVTAELVSDGGSEEAARSQALLMLSRILFLHFVQEKGWLAGDRQFLKNRVRRLARSERPLYDELLVPLFFGCLNTPPIHRASRALELGEIPYLNGGLFDPSSYERDHAGMRVSNQTLVEIFSTFEKFSFCLDENDEDGVHIDPEMLGKVFESLMASDQRASSGSFYTPKEIVDALATSAISLWAAAGNDELARSLKPGLSAPMSGMSVEQAVGLLDRLEHLTVLDPACGSGAFLLSALQCIERLTISLNTRVGRSTDPDLRQKIVERSLFGVDLKREAVRLCELRLWLAIVTDSSASAASVRPLPNLDRNILQGNALLSPLDFLGAGRISLYQKWSCALQLRKGMTERFRHAPPDERPHLYRVLRKGDEELAAAMLEHAITEDEKELQFIRTGNAPLFPRLNRRSEVDSNAASFLARRIEETRVHLANVLRGELDFFSFDVHFSAVLSEGGFDVIIGNPPWVRSSRIEPAARQMFRDRYESFGARGADGKSKGFEQSDLAVAFCEKSFDLLKEGGAMSMLVPAKFASAGYAWKLRERHSNYLSQLHDWSDRGKKLFGADTFPLGITLSKRQRVTRDIAIWSDGQERLALRAEIVTEQEWLLAPPEVSALIHRLRKSFPPLSDTLGRVPLMGVKTGANDRFFLPELVLSGNGASIPGSRVRIPIEHLCRAVRGRDVRRWHAGASCWMLWPPMRGWSNPPAWVLELANHMATTPDSFRLSFVKPEHLGMKVVWKDVSKGLQAAVLPEMVRISGTDFPLIPNQTTYFLDAVSIDEAHFLSAFLNSTVLNAVAIASAEHAKDFHQRFFGTLVSRLPLPQVHANDAVRGDLVRLGRRAVLRPDIAVEIDQIVEKLFGITSEEHEILSAYVRRRLGVR
ncbi:MAG TPA: DNA methyltransferase [Thermoanaerobaculia bacterium]|nr:DNA methyltransferase [Thermoanaerobaculia bacterium]